jgi:hypothetical protein
LSEESIRAGGVALSVDEEGGIVTLSTLVLRSAFDAVGISAGDTGFSVVIEALSAGFDALSVFKFVAVIALEAAVFSTFKASVVAFNTLVVDFGEFNRAFRETGVVVENEGSIAVEASGLVGLAFAAGSMSTFNALSVLGSEVLGAFFNAQSVHVEEFGLAFYASFLVGAF